VARALKALVEKEKPDLVLMGKQAVDGDSNQVAQILAELLDWPRRRSPRTIESEERAPCSWAARSTAAPSSCASKLPAVVTVDLRIVAPKSVYSAKTPATHFKYNEGVRFAALHGDHGREEEAARRGEARRAHGRRQALKVQYAKFERRPPARPASR
jgi:electron transfer flavoprotein beta subunit